MYIILNLHGIAYKVEFNTSISLMSEYIWEELINKSKVKNLTEPVLLLLLFFFISLSHHPSLSFNFCRDRFLNSSLAYSSKSLTEMLYLTGSRPRPARAEKHFSYFVLQRVSEFHFFFVRDTFRIIHLLVPFLFCTCFKNDLILKSGIYLIWSLGFKYI